MLFDNKEKLAELDLKAELAKSPDCIKLREVLLNMVFDYSLGDVDDKEIRGMLRLLANTRDWDKQRDKKVKNAKEMLEK